MNLWDPSKGRNYFGEASLNGVIDYSGYEKIPILQLFPPDIKPAKQTEKFLRLNDEKNVKKVSTSQKNYYNKLKTRLQRDLTNIRKVSERIEKSKEMTQKSKESLTQKMNNFENSYKSYLEDNSFEIKEPSQDEILQEQHDFQCYKEALDKLIESIEVDKNTMFLERNMLLEERKKIEEQRNEFKKDFERVKNERTNLVAEFNRVQDILSVSHAEVEKYEAEQKKIDDLNAKFDKELEEHEAKKKEFGELVNNVNKETRKTNLQRERLLQAQDEINDNIKAFELKKAAYQESADQVTEISKKLKEDKIKLNEDKEETRKLYEQIIEEQEKVLPIKELFLVQYAKIEEERRNLAILQQTLAEEQASLAYEEALIDTQLNMSPEMSEIQKLTIKKNTLTEGLLEFQAKLQEAQKERSHYEDILESRSRAEEQKKQMAAAAEKTKKMLSSYFEVKKAAPQKEKPLTVQIDPVKQKEKKRIEKYMRKKRMNHPKGSSAWFHDGQDDMKMQNKGKQPIFVDTFTEKLLKKVSKKKKNNSESDKPKQGAELIKQYSDKVKNEKNVITINESDSDTTSSSSATLNNFNDKKFGEQKRMLTSNDPSTITIEIPNIIKNITQQDADDLANKAKQLNIEAVMYQPPVKSLVLVKTPENQNSEKLVVDQKIEEDSGSDVFQDEETSPKKPETQEVNQENKTGEEEKIENVEEEKIVKEEVKNEEEKVEEEEEEIQQEGLGVVEQLEDENGYQYTRVITDDGRVFIYFLGEDGNYYVKFMDEDGQEVVQLYQPEEANNEEEQEIENENNGVEK